MLFGRSVTVTDGSPVDLSEGLQARRYKIFVRNRSSITVRLGGIDITPTDGFLLESADGTREFDLVGDPFYAIATSSSGPAVLNVLVYD